MSLFKLKFDITYADGTAAQATTRPASDVSFERHFGITVASLFSDVPTELGAGGDLSAADKSVAMNWIGTAFKTEHTSFLAWHASRDNRTFDEWLDTVEEIEWGFAGVVDPTRPTVSAL